MNTTSPGGHVDIDREDFGDVVAIVEDPTGYASPSRDWEKVAEVAGAAARLVAGPGLGVAAPAAAAAIPVAILLMRGRSAQRRPPLALLAVSDARRLAQRDLLFFPAGGPAVGAVYARHPLRRRDYLPYADFHRLVLHEKCIEAARYLLSLGARDVSISLGQSAGKAGKGEAGASVPSAADVSMTMGFGQDAQGRLAIRINGAVRPSTAEDLIWPDGDPMFKLVRDAARAGAETFHFGLKSEQSSSINAGLAATIEKDLRFNIGGEYKRWEDLAFTVDAGFAPSS